MYFADHPPPHLDARYAAEEAALVIAPERCWRALRPDEPLGSCEGGWMDRHRAELDANRHRARRREAPTTIADAGVAALVAARPREPTGQAPIPGSAGSSSKPGQRNTGRRGYFG
jgi:hypothetical protein